ncbi:bestrophin-2-like isoform X2 [Sitophilus oryzae]|uniref:Bestrophin homolog n=1 Tax=Sitophilus oryzae TaxID=7048 RepID=A0A6J2X3E9_SITOR|nr:bestrophin-2-like isoform X2 [Sitophilus oryzae]
MTKRRRWKGSIYKIVWGDLILFLAIYYALNFSYVYAMNEFSKTHFEKIVIYCSKNANLIPLSFVLGFYVNIVYTRWWNQFTSIPFPDNLALLIGASIKGQDERARIVRRTIVRYVCVTFTLTLTMMSPKVKKRFPTLNHLVHAGLLTQDEKKIVEDLEKEYPNYQKHWLPLAWAANVTTRARHEGIIREDLSVKSIIDHINIFRGKCGDMLAYDWISIPLVYTQVVTIAVYSYFLITVIGNQFITSKDDLLFNFPFMPVLEFFFYMGWLKVAETLINPFGEDDDDFEVVWMIDRHIQTCYLLVDKIHQDHPKLMKDYYWQQTAPDTLPFTIASQQYMKETPVQSAENLKIKKTDQDWIIPEDKGHGHRGKSVWSVLKKSLSRNRNENVGYYLKRIAGDDNADVFDEINTYEQEGPSKISIPLFPKTQCNENVEEFENLKTERMELHRAKLLQYIQLIQATNKENVPDKQTYLK